MFIALDHSLPRAPPSGFTVTPSLSLASSRRSLRPVVYKTCLDQFCIDCSNMADRARRLAKLEELKKARSGEVSRSKEYKVSVRGCWDCVWTRVKGVCRSTGEERKRVGKRDTTTREAH